jgi:hypothetical protein
MPCAKMTTLRCKLVRYWKLLTGPAGANTTASIYDRASQVPDIVWHIYNVRQVTEADVTT